MPLRVAERKSANVGNGHARSVLISAKPIFLRKVATVPTNFFIPSQRGEGRVREKGEANKREL